MILLYKDIYHQNKLINIYKVININKINRYWKLFLLVKINYMF
jgi:hypothetical protein